MTRAAALAAILALGGWSAQAGCRQALALGLDVSSSVDAIEYNLQMTGLAQALDDPRVRRALKGVGGGHVALMVYEWSGQAHQVVVLPWIEVVDDAQVDYVIAVLGQHGRSASNAPTALGHALGFGAEQLAASPDCLRQTLDISGDGVNNAGYRPKQALLNFDFSNITVNGLVVAGRDSGELRQYYQQEVVYGADAFVEMAAGYGDYTRAIKRKLLRELTVLALSQLD
ncbi:MAG TPA: DUF1194 domain-containing protein [Rhodobacteraceae bacterium]|nr:DUF1194 domain-containing protein [Paracoccaceae bacterium]